MNVQNTLPRSSGANTAYTPRTRRIIIAVAVVLTIICSAVFIIFHPVTVTEVRINGESAGIVFNVHTARALAKQICAEYETKVGEDLSDIVSITYEESSRRGKVQYLSDAEWKNALCAAYEAQLSECYRVSLDGITLAFVKSADIAQNACQRIIDEQLAYFAQIMPHEGDVMVELTSEYQVTPCLALSDRLNTEEELYAALSASGFHESFVVMGSQSVSLFSAPGDAVPESVRDPFLSETQLPLPERNEVLKAAYVIETKITESLAYTTEVIYDDARMPYYSRTLSEGSDGLAAYTYTIAYDINGHVLSKTVKNMEVLREPVPETVVRGCAVREPGVVTGTYIRPIDVDNLAARVTSAYGAYRENLDKLNTSHSGIDLWGDAGTPIYASDGGTILKAEWHFSYGNYVLIDHGNGNLTRYVHLQAIDAAITKGALVAQGQYLGEMGSTGNSTASHLHFEVYRGFVLVDPAQVLDMKNGGF